VKDPAESLSTPSPWLGTGCCLLSALCYTAVNICLRQLAELKIEPAWVICVKEAVAVAVVGPWLMWRIHRGVRFSFPMRALAVLVLAGLAVQLAGNLGIQWALGIIGLAISMPVTFGVMLAASAVFTVALFRESLPTRSVVAVVTVVVSVTLLSVGAAGKDGSSETSSAQAGTVMVLLGIAAACVGGAMFASLGAAIRYAGKARVPVAVTVAVVTGMGVISLGTLSFVRLGPAKMLATDSSALAWMIASGVFNLIAFALITKGLQLTTLVHANVLNASQVALGATAGILLFHEAYNPWLIWGIALTIVGVALYGHTRSKQESG